MNKRLWGDGAACTQSMGTPHDELATLTATLKYARLTYGREDDCQRNKFLGDVESWTRLFRGVLVFRIPIVQKQLDGEFALIACEDNNETIQIGWRVKFFGIHDDWWQRKDKSVRGFSQQGFGLASHDIGDFSHAISNQVFMYFVGDASEYPPA